MSLHRFLLDATFNEARDIKRSQDTFIYLDAEGRLNAWITSKDQSNITTLKAFKETTAGTMTLQDLLKSDLPIQIIGIESNGCLVAGMDQGSLRYRCTNGKIIGLADICKNRNQQPWSADPSAPPVLFPGMQQSDCFSCGDLVVSRHETIANSPYGDPLFPQSLLLVRPECKLEQTKGGQQWIAIGNSQVDNNLNIIPCAEQQLFDIPIINFIVDSSRPNGTVFLIGWNRKAMQIISINQDANDQGSICAQTNEIIELKDLLLEDLSKPWINCQGRLSFWRDMTNAGQFYTCYRD